MKQKRATFFLLCALAFFLFLFYPRKTVISVAATKNVPETKKDNTIVGESERVITQKETLQPSENTTQTIPQKAPLSLQRVLSGFSDFAQTYKQKQEQRSDLSITETRFLEKILQSVGTMCNIYRNKLASYTHEKTMVHCAVSLARNGLLEQCTISKTSGNIMLDSLIKQIIFEAGASFPPLPQSITKIPYYLIFQFDFQGWISFTVLLPR